jgi:tRNA dimethylallyltransferase
MPSPDPLVVILGPTAVGKTEIAIQLAERLNGEIISADSRLFYRGMDIGTAKPSMADRQRVPHHLIDITEPDDVISLALFQRLARQAIAETCSHQRLPFLVGGTGQYIRAVIQAWEVPPAQPDPMLRSALENWAGQIGMQGLHDRLAVLDPQAAAGIDPRNLRRTIRALEVTLSTGHRFSEQRRSGPSPYKVLALGLSRPRSELYARIDARIQAMLEGGLIGEVQALIERGYSPELPTLSAIGYREVIAYIRGNITLEEAQIKMKRATRIFVRRQSNWFKPGDPAIRWFQVGPNTIKDLEEIIRGFFV